MFSRSYGSSLVLNLIFMFMSIVYVDEVPYDTEDKEDMKQLEVLYN